MVEPKFLLILRENYDEIINRWLENCQGHIAEEFEQMLRTPMGHSVAYSMYSLMLKYLEAEEYETGNIFHDIRKCASEASFRRAAVGFSLPDIVTTVIAFREAVQQTLINHFCSISSEGEALLECFTRLTRLGDAMIEGGLSGFFTFSKFGDTSGEAAEAL